jgi:hypothetical protein
LWDFRRSDGAELALYWHTKISTFFYGKGNENYELRTGLFVHKRIISAVKRVDFISDRMLYVILRGRWCDIIVLNVHASTEDKIDYIKNRFYEELEHVFYKFPKYHIKNLLADFNAKVGKKNIFKPTIGNDSLHEISNENGVRIVNFALSNILVSKVQSSHDVTSINAPGPLMERHTIK